MRGANIACLAKDTDKQVYVKDDKELVANKLLTHNPFQPYILTHAILLRCLW